MKEVRLRAKIRISTSKGSFSAGDIFEIEEKYAKRLIEAGYAEKLESAHIQNIEANPEKELDKLKMDELRKLAEAIGFEADEMKKPDLIKEIIKEAKEIPTFKEILAMKAEDIRAYLNE